MSVREIRGWTPATAVPHAPGFVRGVINLRGIVLPIVDLADRLGELIVHDLTSHQREVLVALAIDGVDSKDLATRLNSTPGALYKTLHDARRKLKRGLADWELNDRRESCDPTSTGDRAEARRLAQRMLVCAEAQVVIDSGPPFQRVDPANGRGVCAPRSDTQTSQAHPSARTLSRP